MKKRIKELEVYSASQNKIGILGYANELLKRKNKNASLFSLISIDDDAYVFKSEDFKNIELRINKTKFDSNRLIQKFNENIKSMRWDFTYGNIIEKADDGTIIPKNDIADLIKLLDNYF